MVEQRPIERSLDYPDRGCVAGDSVLSCALRHLGAAGLKRQAPRALSRCTGPFWAGPLPRLVQQADLAKGGRQDRRRGGAAPSGHRAKIEFTRRSLSCGVPVS